MWFWVLYRAKKDGPVILGWRHPWEGHGLGDHSFEHGHEQVIDNSEAVTLCRGRSKCLSTAIGFRYVFSDAHVAYIKSLKSVSESLNQFIDGIDTMCNVTGSVDPQFPTEQKDELDSEQKVEELDSDSESHIHFPPDSELSDCGSDDKIYEDISRVQHHLHIARNQPMSSSSNFPQPYVVEGNNIHPYSSTSDHGHTSSYNDNYGYPSNYSGYYGESSSHPVSMPEAGNAPQPPSASYRSPSAGYNMSSSPLVTRSEVRNAALPPQPGYYSELNGGYYGSYFHPVTMLLNLSDNHGMNYVNYSVPSRDWNEFREEEGIPDLKDVDDASFASSSIDDEINEEGNESVDDDDHTNDDFKEGIDVREKIDNDDNLGIVENNNVTSDVKERVEEKNEAMLRIKCYNNLSKVAAAIKPQFDKASESAAELSEIIEVGKRQYHQKLPVHKSVTCIGFDVQTFFKSVIIGARSHLLSKNHLLTAKEDEDAHAHYSLSSTLQKLIIWETKLYDEVMEEEKMRFAYGKKCRELKRHIERSAEQQKVDPVMPVLKRLSMKIRMSIHAIGFISTKITKLRDEALCPQVCQLIKGLARMWSTMYECYKTLHQAIPEENFIQSFSCGNKSCSEAQIEKTKQLGLELIEWTIIFSTWINAQKDFIKALNGWLLIAVCCVKEETSDGVVPFSPSKLDAPSIFVICNHWEQTIQTVSEKEVILSMQSFSSAILNLWKKQKTEQRQKLMANKDMEKEMLIMEKEEKEMRRIVKAWSKKLMHVSGHNGIVMSEETIEESDLHVGLLQMFESMENYCAANLKVYEELNMCIEEENGIAG